MKQEKTKRVDWFGDEYVYAHVEVLTAPDLNSTEKLVMFVIRQLAFNTGTLTAHIPEIIRRTALPDKTVRRTLKSLKAKRWLKGKTTDGWSMDVRMAPNWRSRDGKPATLTAPVADTMTALPRSICPERGHNDRGNAATLTGPSETIDFESILKTEDEEEGTSSSSVSKKKGDAPSSNPQDHEGGGADQDMVPPDPAMLAGLRDIAATWAQPWN